MLNPHKNAYLRLVCPIDPMAIEKSVQRAMSYKSHESRSDREHDKHQKAILPPLPTYFANNMDVIHSRIGYGQEGLKRLIRQIHSHDRVTSWQAIHSIEERVQIAEDAFFLIRNNVLDRLLPLMMTKHPYVRQQICFIIMHISTYLQGREKILRRPIVIENLLSLTVSEHEQDLRYSAAIAIRTLARADRPSCIYVSKQPDIVPKLLDRVLNDHAAIVMHHMRTLEVLFELDPETGLRANAFEVMLKLFYDKNSRILGSCLDCLAQLCAHPVGRRIADEKDLTIKLRHYLKWPMANVIISALGLMAYTTLSERAKWRAREFSHILPKMLISLCFRPNKPIMQLRAMQVLTNLCDLPDIRHCLKGFNKRYTEDIEFRTMEKFKGNSECTSYGQETGISYKTMCRELTKIIRANKENVRREHVHSYRERLKINKQRLLYAVNQQTYNDANEILPKE